MTKTEFTYGILVAAVAVVVAIGFGLWQSLVAVLLLTLLFGVVERVRRA